MSEVKWWQEFRVAGHRPGYNVLVACPGAQCSAQWAFAVHTIVCADAERSLSNALPIQ